jgi:hypothetical protein
MYIMNEVLGFGLLGRTEYETHQQRFASVLSKYTHFICSFLFFDYINFVSYIAFQILLSCFAKN